MIWDSECAFLFWDVLIKETRG